ncbi:MAG TPA: GNAT family N-acetyltransferase [Micromonosporaceae bacterium]|nr:GNAT family N-acetyltransferase [Micromonosporaceae bacterium]
MINETTLIRGRAAVLAATSGHPYARLTTGGDGPVTGYLLNGTTIWTGPGPWGPIACALGDAERAATVFAALADTGDLGGASWLHLPRASMTALAALAAQLPVEYHDQWEFRWTSNPPPPQPGEEQVIQLTDADHSEIAALIEEAFPDTTTRPGDPRIVRWFGLRAGERLVACGADRSKGGVGFLAGLTVATDLRGRGLGAALTAAMTRRLLTDHAEVALGVITDNQSAVRLYERLGFTSTLTRTSVRLG